MNVFEMPQLMGPMVTVKPGQTLRHGETWVRAGAKSAPTTQGLCGLL